MNREYIHSVYTITRKDVRRGKDKSHTGFTQHKTGAPYGEALKLARELASEGWTIVAMWRQPVKPTPEECEEISMWKPHRIWFGGNEYKKA